MCYKHESQYVPSGKNIMQKGKRYGIIASKLAFEMMKLKSVYILIGWKEVFNERFI